MLNPVLAVLAISCSVLSQSPTFKNPSPIPGGHDDPGRPSGLTPLPIAGRAEPRHKAWGTNPSTTKGLIYGYYGGPCFNGRVWVVAPDGSVVLEPDLANYIERTPAGLVSSNSHGWTSGCIPIAKVLTGKGQVVNVQDFRGDAEPGSIVVQQSLRGAIPRSLAEKNAEHISLADFGAVGDNVADDTSAVRAAFRAFRGCLNLAKGAYSDSREGPMRIYVPRGQYRISGPIDIFAGVEVYGDVAGAPNQTAFIQLDKTQPLFYIHPKNYNDLGITINNSVGINQFRNFVVKSGDKTSSLEAGALFKFLSPYESTLRMEKIGGVSGDSPGPVGHIDTIFDNIWFQESTGSAVACDQGIFAPQFINCTFDIARRGIEISGTASGDLRINNCQFYSCVTGAIVCSTNKEFKIWVNDSWMRGCGSPFSSPGFQSAIDFNSGDLTVGELHLNNVWFARVDVGGGTLLNGGSRFWGSTLEMTDCSFIDMDKADGNKFWLVLANDISIKGNHFKSNSIQKYELSSFLNFSCKVNPKTFIVVNNKFENANKVSFQCVINSDYVISAGQISNNQVVGPRASTFGVNIALSKNMVNGNSGYNPFWMPGAEPSPGGGLWSVGDIVWNTSPKPGGWIGWVCVESGTPGVWKGFGLIQ